MRALWLVIALGLLGVGFYRLLFVERRRALKPGGGSQPARPAPPKAEPVSARKASQDGVANSPKPRAPAAPEPAKKSPPKPEPGKAPKPEPGKASKPAPNKTVPARHDGGSSPPGKMLPSLLQEHDPDEDITIITLAPPADLVAARNAGAGKAGKTQKPVEDTASAPRQASAPADAPPRLQMPLDEDEEEEGSSHAPAAVPIVYDEDAAVDEPTRVSALILVSAAAQTDQGRRRRRNEDSMLVLEDHHLFVVADGMGGHAGGDVASKMAVDIIGDAFQKNEFTGESYADVPRRGAELALAIQMANKAIYDHARANSAYQGMGTTVVSARFSPNKQRVYFGHVGDSRCYRLRGAQLTQVTTDHTMAAQGVTGPLASHLNRAVGVQPGVKVDLIIARPRPDDVYLLCSDGLSKMVPDEEIQGILNEQRDLDRAVTRLVERANARGGRDNITVVLVQVQDPKSLAKYILDKAATQAT